MDFLWGYGHLVTTNIHYIHEDTSNHMISYDIPALSRCLGVGGALRVGLLHWRHRITRTCIKMYTEVHV